MKTENMRGFPPAVPAVRPLASFLQLAMVVFTVVDMVLLQPWAVWVMAAAAAGFVTLQIGRAPPGIRRTCGVLIAAILALLPLIEAPQAALERGLRIGGLIASLLLSVALLSRAALRVERMRQLVGALFTVPAEKRFVTLTVASQFFGGFLGLAGITMLMEMASQVPMEDAQEKLACYSAIARGYAAANLWSPMYSNVSILLAISPGLDWAAVFPAAVLLALASLALGWAQNGWHGRRAACAVPAVRWNPAALVKPAAPIIARMVFFLLLAVGASRIAQVPVAAAIIVCAPVAAWILNALQTGPARGGRQLHRDFCSLGTLAGEVLLFLVSGCAGTVIAAAMPTAWTTSITAALAPFPLLGCLFLSASVVLLSCTSVHPMLSGIVVATGFSAAALHLAPVVHVLAVLAGLGLAVIMTPFSVISLMASRFSGLPLLAVSMRAHLAFVALCMALSSFILSGMNGWFQHNR